MNKLFRIKGFLPYTVMLFINAFVDLGHKIIIQNTVFKIYNGETQVVLTAIINGLILLPYILLFTPAGFLSDKFPKSQVMRYSALAAVVAVMVSTWSYYQGWFWCAFAMTLLLGVQAAIYSPAKYGFIKELVGDANLSQGNGVVQAVTIVAILLGTFVFSALFEALLKNVTIDSTQTVLHFIAPLGWILLALTLIEFFLAHYLPAIAAADHAKVFSLSRYVHAAYFKNNRQLITVKPVIAWAMVGLAMFWAISQVVLSSFPAFAKVALVETNTLVIQGILACTGFGIVAGALVAGKISRDTMTRRLILIGTTGFALGLGLIPLLDTRVGMAVTFMALGFFGGLFTIPLNALIQHHAEKTTLGSTLAASNWVQNIAMFAGLCITIVLSCYGVASATLFYLLMLAALAVSLLLIKKLS